MSQTPQTRFQFALRDLLIFAFFVGVGMAAIPFCWEADRETMVFWLPTAFVFLLVSAVGSLEWANAHHFSDRDRSGCLAAVLLATTLGLWSLPMLLGLLLHDVHITTYESCARTNLESLRLAQFQYSTDARCWASDPKALERYLTNPRLAQAIGDAGAPGVEPCEGYVFRMLVPRNPALGEEADLVFLAVPVPYRRGRLTLAFTGNRGEFVKDLGRDTVKIANEMTEFTPDSTWQKER
jgi:hypothetical protein